jgi:hypothetical protein
MAEGPISKDWTGDHAVLLVHGIGNATPGSYDWLVKDLEHTLGAQAEHTTIYELYYDEYNDWMADKTQLHDEIGKLVEWMKWKGGDDDVAGSAAEFGGDIIWPILSVAGREMVRTAYLAQLKQIVQDGIREGLDGPEQRLSIICHSLGCFHTYEVLHTIANEPQHGLTPASDGVRFANVIMMASPVQLIRSAALDLNRHIGGAVPKSDQLATTDREGLSIPGEVGYRGRWVTSTDNFVSIAGNMDPVGGHILGKKMSWGYMDMSGQKSYIDSQKILPKTDFMATLKGSLRTGAPPDIKPSDPHSWGDYMTRHASDLIQWLG